MNQSLYDIEQGRRWGHGRVNFSICVHNKITIRNYRETGACRACSTIETSPAFFIPNTTPIFNRGLGCETRGTRHAERVAKRQGKIPVGDAPMRTIAKQHWPDHPLTESL